MAESVEVEALRLAIEKLDVGPGDVLTFRPEEYLDDREAAVLREVVMQVLANAGVDGVGLLVVLPGMELTVEKAGNG